MIDFEAIEAVRVPESGIPSLGGQKIGALLRHLVAEMSPHHSIVEAGAWLGAGTWHLADAAASRVPSPPLHVYDRFQANKTEAERASAAGIPLEAGADTLDVVKRHISTVSTKVNFHKCDLTQCEWNGDPVGLLVDDAAKQSKLFSALLTTFGPSFVPGETVLVLMDFHYWKKHETSPNVDEYRAQADFMAAHTHAFQHMGDPNIRKTSTAVFRYVAPLDFETVVAEWFEKS